MGVTFPHPPLPYYLVDNVLPKINRFLPHVVAIFPILKKYLLYLFEKQSLRQR